MSPELVKKLKALIGGFIVAVETNNLSLDFAAFMSPMFMFLDSELKKETGQHFTMQDYIEAAREEAFSHLPDGSEEQQIAQDLMKDLMRLQDLVEKEKNPEVDARIEINDKDSDPVARILKNGLDKKERLN